MTAPLGARAVGLAVAAVLVTATTVIAAALTSPLTSPLTAPHTAPDSRLRTAQTPGGTFTQGPVAVAGLPGAPDGYDGTYEFVRVQFGSGGGGFSRRGADWAHDYPRADREIISVLNEVTNMRPRPDAFRVLRMDDPEIFSFPVIYIVEIGSWRPSATELAALRDYLRKGGFLIVDDFRGGQLGNLYRIMSQVAPEYEVLEVPDDHPIFDSFFRIEAPRELPTHPTYGRMQPVYLGLFEDNDPTGRLLAIFNYDNDIAEWWETFSTGYYPIDLSNEAFKFGVNYIVYAHTH